MRSLRLALILPLALLSRQSLADPPPSAELPPGYERYAPVLPPAPDPMHSYQPTLPYGYRPPELGTERRSGGMIAAGVAFLAIGATFLPIGTAVAAGNSRDCNVITVDGQCGVGSGQMVGMGLLIGATAAIATGLPLIVLGAQRVPIEPLRIVARAPQVTLGLGHVDLRWQF